MQQKLAVNLESTHGVLKQWHLDCFSFENFCFESEQEMNWFVRVELRLERKK